MKADQLAADKITLTQKLQATLDKHIRQLDMQMKVLCDRNEPGFTDPDEVPSLLRPSAANQSPHTIRPGTQPMPNIPTPLNPVVSSATAATTRVANPQVRQTQAAPTNPASTPATPAASMILNRQTRESSAGPGNGVPKRGPRANSGLGNLPVTSSGLARHSSLGPGTPKTQLTAAGVQRAGSAGPRTTAKGTGAGPGRKAGTPSAGVGRKKGTPTVGPGNKSNLSRVKRPAKNSSSSAANSDLSDAESASESNGSTSRRATPARGSVSQNTAGAEAEQAPNHPHSDNHNHPHHQHPPNTKREKDGAHGPTTKKKPTHHSDDDDAMDVDEDEGGDDKKYCICQNVSFGDMVACDNDACPFEWFHWSCVGLRSEPTGTWFCPVCTEKTKKGK